jgi:hypothetical protein
MAQVTTISGAVEAMREQITAASISPYWRICALAKVDKLVAELSAAGLAVSA